MSNVIKFPPNSSQWESGLAVCVQCDHEWTATAPTDTEFLECPSCHSMSGEFSSRMSPENELVKKIMSSVYFYEGRMTVASALGALEIVKHYLTREFLD